MVREGHAMSKRNGRGAKARRRQVRQDRAEWPAVMPAYLASDEAYLEHVLSTPEAALTSVQRQLAREIRAHHPEVGAAPM